MTQMSRPTSSHMTQMSHCPKSGQVSENETPEQTWPGVLDIARSLLNTAACRGEYLEVELLERDTDADGMKMTYFVVLRPLDLLNR